MSNQRFKIPQFRMQMPISHKTKSSIWMKGEK